MKAVAAQRAGRQQRVGDDFELVLGEARPRPGRRRRRWPAARPRARPPPRPGARPAAPRRCWRLVEVVVLVGVDHQGRDHRADGDRATAARPSQKRSRIRLQFGPPIGRPAAAQPGTAASDSQRYSEARLRWGRQGSPISSTRCGGGISSSPYSILHRFADAEVAAGEDVGPLEVEDQEHLGGPLAEAAHRDDLLDHLLVGELVEAVQLQLAAEHVGGEVADVLDLAAGEAGSRAGPPRSPRAAARARGCCRRRGRAPAGRSSAPLWSRAAGRRSPAAAPRRRRRAAPRCAARSRVARSISPIRSISAAIVGSEAASALRAAALTVPSTPACASRRRRGSPRGSPRRRSRTRAGRSAPPPAAR